MLEPFLSGEYIIPPMPITFRKKGADEEEDHTLETEEVTVTVRSLLPENIEDLTIHEIKPPVDLPRKSYALAAAAALLVGAGLMSGIFVLVNHRRKRAAAPPPLLPQEIAYRQLEQLVAEDLVGQGRIKEFYQRVSDILRHYIENRFGLHAPERTTEEFLAELGATRTLEPGHQGLLKQFLGHCDLVKFAEHQPRTEDIQNTFDACKTFIAETEPVTEPTLKQM